MNRLKKKVWGAKEKWSKPEGVARLRNQWASFLWAKGLNSLMKAWRCRKGK